MAMFCAILIIISVYLSDSCHAQVKNSSLPLVMWHGMGMCAVYCRLRLFAFGSVHEKHRTGQLFQHCLDCKVNKTYH